MRRILHFFLFANCFLPTAYCLSQPVASPDVKCLAVQPNGDVVINWIIPASGSFVQYYVDTSSNPGVIPFTTYTTIPTYSSASCTHFGAGTGKKRMYYLIYTESSGSIFSTPVDTFSTIFLVVTNQTDKAKLDWNAIASPLPSTSTGWYRIYREYPSTVWTLLDSTTALTFTDTIDICDDSLTYRIEISDNTGCASVSNVDGGMFKDLTPPILAPIDTVSVDGSGLATISWYSSPSPDADSVVIYLAGPPNTPIDTVPVLPALYTYTASNAANTSETFSIAFIDSCGNISIIGEQHHTLYLSASFDICAATANLSWNTYINMLPSNPNQYEIFRRVNAGPYSLIATQDSLDTTYSDTGLVLGNSYCYFIRADNGTKTSTSNVQCFSASVTQPPAFTYNRYATVLSDNRSITVRAHVDSSSTSVYNYLLQRATGTSGSFSTVKILPKPPGNSLIWTDNTALPTSNSYSYRWQAMDSCAHVIMNSNTATTIYLSANIAPNLDISLSWNDYSTWSGAVDSYYVYRAVDGIWNPSPIGSVEFTGTGGMFTDDVSQSFTSKGIFSYYVVAREKMVNTFGFKDTSASNIAKVYEYPKIYVPNTFTPNGDGLNDIFIPAIGFIEPSAYTLRIFDNTGTQVMGTTVPSEGWDGKKKGNDCQEGVYMYLINCKASNGDDSQISGTVLLIR